MSIQKTVIKTEILNFKVSFLDNAYTFRKIIEALSKLLDEVIIRFSSTGITILEIDDSRIGLIELHIHKDDMEKYTFSKKFSWNVSLEDLSKFLKRFDKKIDTKIVFSKKDDNNVLISLISEKGDKTIKRDFSLRHISGLEPTMEKEHTANLHSIKYLGNFQLELKHYIRILKDADLISATLEFKITKNNIICSTIGAIGEFTQDIPYEFRHFKILKKDISGIFALEYLKIIEKLGEPFGKTKLLTLYLSNNQPMKAFYEFFEKSYIVYYLAPRIEEEEEDDEDDY